MEYSTLNLLTLDADIAAKAGLDVAITNMRFPVSDLLTCVNQLCVKEWQQLRNQCSSNKLYGVQPVVGRSVSSSLGRYSSVLANRFRIGHTRLTNSYLLKGESQPVCEACLLYTSPSPRDRTRSRMPSSA